jgi:hypothetical protein
MDKIDKILDKAYDFLLPFILILLQLISHAHTVEIKKLQDKVTHLEQSLNVERN